MASTTGTIFNLTIHRPTRTDASLIASPFFHLHLLSKAAQEPAMSSLLGRFSYIRRALYRDSGPVQNMGVDHGCGDIRMSQEFLHRAYIVMGLQQMRGKGMPEGMTTDLFGQASLKGRLLDRPLKAAFVYVMPADLSASRVRGQGCRWEHILPTPFFARRGVLSSQGWPDIYYGYWKSIDNTLDCTQNYWVRLHAA